MELIEGVGDVCEPFVDMDRLPDVQQAT
jgi:hypothetical protein